MKYVYIDAGVGDDEPILIGPYLTEDEARAASHTSRREIVLLDGQILAVVESAYVDES